MTSYPLLSTKNGRTWDISSNIINTTGAITCNGGAQTGTFYSNNVSAIRVPNGPSSTRPSGLQGYIRYNTDLDASSNFLEYYDSPANAWIPLAPSPIIKSVTPNFVTDVSGAAGYYNTYPLLISGGNFLPGSTVSYRDPSGIITSAPTTYYYSGLQLGATVPSAVYNPSPYKSPFSIIVTNPGNYIGILNNALSATSSRSFTVSGLTGGSSATTYLSTTSGTGTTAGTPFANGSTVYTFTTTANTTSTSLFTVTPNFTGTITYLVVAGGGAGSDDGTTTNGNGGGGAGGYLTGTLSVSNGVSYSVQVGGGGVGVTGQSSAPTAGGNSIFASITSYGGGRGGYYSGQAGGPGGSGGGGGATNGGSGLGTSGQGNNGGSGGSSTGGGGGGGAGGVGANGSGGSGGNGGAGLSNTISGATLYYAGGAGGSPGGLGNNGLGTLFGGGGNAASSSGGNGVTGTSGTGGGGGASVAGPSSPSNNTSGSGGSGIVILRFNSFS
jgi:hypothetical protein